MPRAITAKVLTTVAALLCAGCGDDDGSGASSTDTSQGTEDSRAGDSGGQATDLGGSSSDAPSTRDTAGPPIDLGSTDATSPMAGDGDDGTPDALPEDVAAEDVAPVDAPGDDAATSDEGGGELPTQDCDGPLTNELFVNEWLLSPAMGSAGDANCDGTRNAVDDEFIELVNGTARCLDVGGMTVETSSAGFGDARYVVPSGTVVPAGGALVIFGGGVPSFAGAGAGAHCADLGGCDVAIFSAAPSSLAFAPNEEWVVLNSRFGVQVAEARCGERFGRTCPVGESLTRAADGERSADFRPHSEVGVGAHSPGRQADGSPLAATATCQ